MPQHDVWVRTIIDTVVDGIVIIDEQGTIRLFNAGCRRLFGYEPEEAVGQNVRMLMPSPYTEQHDGYLQHYRATGEKRIIGIVHDLTEEARAEKRTQDLQAELLHVSRLSAMQGGSRRELTIGAVRAEEGQVAVSVVDTGPSKPMVSRSPAPPRQRRFSRAV